MVQANKTDESQLASLSDALRDLGVAVRRATPGSEHDKAASLLLAHLIALGPVRASDLAERACLDPSTVSRHLKGLEDSGYLQRSPDPDDRRAVLIEVSPDGKALVDTMQHDRATLLANAVSGWSDDDVTTLSRLVRRLAHDLENR